jgi:uncharacterized protein (DUF58 family)
VNDVFAGEYHSVFKGRGMEFDEVREYQVGDDIRTIDWNVTARYGHPFVKRYVEERELTVMLLVDASSSGEFGTGWQLKGELAVEICALLAFSAIKNNDKVGLIIFTDKVEKVILPKKGRKHVLRVIRELLYFNPEQKKTDIKLALDYLNKVLTRKAIVFLISDFLGTGYEMALNVANKRHDLIGITIRDPREIDLPPLGIIEFEDAETGETIVIDTYDNEIRKSFAEVSSEGRSNLELIFKKLGVDYINVMTDKPYINSIIRFFQKRARRF